MAVFSAHKVVAALPSDLTPDAIYAVRVGQGFDLYVTDATGGVAHKVNTPQSWMTLVARPSSAAGAATIDGTAGDVRVYTKSGMPDIYRFIPSNGDVAEDAFYSGFDGTSLSGLIAKRG